MRDNKDIKEIIDRIEPLANREIFILTIGVYIGIVVNHMDLWLMW